MAVLIFVFWFSDLLVLEKYMLNVVRKIQHSEGRKHANDLEKLCIFVL